MDLSKNHLIPQYDWLKSRKRTALFNVLLTCVLTIFMTLATLGSLMSLTSNPTPDAKYMAIVFVLGTLAMGERLVLWIWRNMKRAEQLEYFRTKNNKIETLE